MRIAFVDGQLAIVPQAMTLPREIVPLKSPRINQDIRITLAYSLFETCEEGNILLYGTTRSGRTTSLIAESINRSEPFVCIEPTTRIATETVRIAAGKSDLIHTGSQCNVINVPSNKDWCEKIKDMIAENPQLEKLPVIPFPVWCYECYRGHTCENLRILRSENVDGVSMTYHKLVALMLSPNPVAKHILHKIRNSVKNAVFDECHKLEIEETKRVTLSEHSKSGDVKFNFNQYDKLKGNWKILDVVNEFKDIIYKPDVIKASEDVLKQAQDNKRYFESSLRCIFEHDCGSKSNRWKLYSGVYREIVEICENLNRYNLKIDDLLPLYDMLAIVTSPKIQICALRDNGTVRVQLAAVDTMHRLMITHFIKSIQKNRRVILTSGTINNNFNYSTLFFTPVNKIIWGPDGDPLNTCSHMHVFADHKKYKIRSGDRRYSLTDNISNITDDIIKIKYEHFNVKIVAMNARLASDLKKALEEKNVYLGEHEIDYYNSDRSLGVECDVRAIITVGLAYKPANAFDVVTEDADDSYVMLQESIHADTYQAICRAKDPDGKNNSFVFMLGSNLNDVDKVLTWGVNRIVKSDMTKTGRTCDVLIRSEPIAKPTIEMCKNVEDMLDKARRYKTARGATV